jgi:hypothetical protein
VPSLPASPRLRRILLAYTINQVGTWLAYVALLLSTYDHTHHALAVAGLLLAGRLLPALLTPTLVALFESSGRRDGLSMLYAVEAVVAVALAGFLWHFWLPALIVLVAIDGTAALTAGALLRATAARVAVEEVAWSENAPGENAFGQSTPEAGAAQDAPGKASPALREEADSAVEDSAVESAQRSANAALNMAFTAAVTLGPAVSGAIVAAAGSPAALLLDALSFAVCGALLLNLQTQPWEKGGTGSPGVRSRIAAAWGHLQAVPQLRSLLTAEALAIVCFASVEPLVVIYVKSALHGGDRGFGFLTAAWGVGMVLGGLTFARGVHRPLRPMLVAGTLAGGMAYVGFAASPTLAIACAVAVLGGWGNGVQWPSLISAVQKLTPPRLQGRLMGAVESLGGFCPAVGFLLGGALGSLTSARTAMLVAGLAAICLTGVFLWITRAETTATETDMPPEGLAASGPPTEALAEHR